MALQCWRILPQTAPPSPFLTPQDINIRLSQCPLVKNDQIMFIVWIISLIINDDARLLRRLSLLSVFSGGSWELERVKLNTCEEEGGRREKKRRREVESILY